MFARILKKHLDRLLKSYPVITLTGPRQAGKTTLVREMLSDRYRYFTLEDPDVRAYAKEDPRGFLAQHDYPLILDEAQNVPELFSYIQGIVDQRGLPGQFILTGSQNFLLLEQISQSLAGRTAVLHLYPLEMEEIQGKKGANASLEGQLIRGFYPRVYQESFIPHEWYNDYIQTYLERDLRNIQRVHDLEVFRLFLKMCAGRVGQLLDLTSLGNDCGVSQKTARGWIALLESSFILYLLRPHYRNYSKRLIKSPKLYFYDTGLLCALLNIQSEEALATHYLRGGIFESFVISELKKRQAHRLATSKLYYWRDRSGHEVDCILERGEEVVPIEIKSGKTFKTDFFAGLDYYKKLSGCEKGYLIYGGEMSQKREQAEVLSWRVLDEILL